MIAKRHWGLKMIINPKSLINDIENLYEVGVARGHTTGWSNVDEFFTVKHGEFTVITGMPSHGKSEWLDALCVNLAIQHNYRIAMFSPENHPLEMHAKKIIEKYAGKPFFGSHRMSHDAFWDWCISNGIHNEDYILDNYGDLFEDFADGIDDKDFIYV